MPASIDNTSQSPAPFVDQRPDGLGVSKIDPSDPAAPMYRLLAKMRSPVTLRDLMIHPVRTGYIGQEQPIAAADLPKSAVELYPKIGVWKSPFLRRPAAYAARSSAHRLPPPAAGVR